MVQLKNCLSGSLDTIRYGTILIYCSWVSTQWQWSLHCTQKIRTVIYVVGQ